MPQKEGEKEQKEGEKEGKRSPLKTTRAQMKECDSESRTGLIIAIAIIWRDQLTEMTLFWEQNYSLQRDPVWWLHPCNKNVRTGEKEEKKVPEIT